MKIKGYIHVVGYKVSVDENLDPGRYGFRIDHDHDRTHYFSSDEKSVVRDWMKAIMKATIDRDYTSALKKLTHPSHKISLIYVFYSHRTRRIIL